MKTRRQTNHRKKTEDKTYPGQILLHKKLTIQSGTLIGAKHSFKNYFGHAKQLSASISNQFFLYPVKNISMHSITYR